MKDNDDTAHKGNEKRITRQAARNDATDYIIAVIYFEI